MRRYTTLPTWNCTRPSFYPCFHSSIIRGGTQIKQVSEASRIILISNITYKNIYHWEDKYESAMMKQENWSFYRCTNEDNLIFQWYHWFHKWLKNKCIKYLSVWCWQIIFRTSPTISSALLQGWMGFDEDGSRPAGRLSPHAADPGHRSGLSAGGKYALNSGSQRG